MAVILPGATGYLPGASILDVVPAKAHVDAHVERAINDAHWNLARRGKRLHFSDSFRHWDGGATGLALDVAKHGAGAFFYILLYVITTGPAKAADVTLFFDAWAQVTGGAASTLRYSVFTATSPLVLVGAPLDLVIAAAPAPAARYSGNYGTLLEPLTDYLIVTYVSLGAGATLELMEHGCGEVEETVAANLP